MASFQKNLVLSTSSQRELIDITDSVVKVVNVAKIWIGLCNVSVAHSTASILSNENESGLRNDFINLFKTIEHDGPFEHDRIDNNASAHLLSGVIGQNQSYVVTRGQIQLGTWQNIFLAEFDGPRPKRKITITVIGD